MMIRHKDFRGVQLFVLITFLYSWPISFVVDAWLIPMFFSQDNPAAGWLIALFGHMLIMAGPALGAIVMWRWYHKEALPPWKWSRPGHYVLVVLVAFMIWTMPALVGLALVDTFRLRWPLEPFRWVLISASFTVVWLAGLGEEVGWCAYLLPRLAPHVGRSRALVIAGAIRGLWHWPVLVGPVIAQVISGEKTPGSLVVMSAVFVFQLILSNAFVGSIFGWVWYKTESLPLVGWLHQWLDAARDVTHMMIVGYSSSLWFTSLVGIPHALIGGIALTLVAREERANMWTLAPPQKAREDVERSVS